MSCRNSSIENAYIFDFAVALVLAPLAFSLIIALCAAVVVMSLTREATVTTHPVFAKAEVFFVLAAHVAPEKAGRHG